MESLKTMHIKRFVAHLLTFRHTVYYRIWFFCRPFRRTGREHHKTSDKPPPAGVGSRDGLLYVYHTADCSPLWCVAGCVVLYRTQRRPLVRCRSPPNVQDSQKFLNDLEDKTMRYRNNGQIEEELQIRFTGYLIQAVKRTRRDYLNTLNQYSNSEILTDTTYTTGQTLEQEVTEHLPLWDVIESNALFYALKRLNERERYVFLSHVLDKCPFDLIGVRLGLTYKGAAAVYYRAVQKLRKSIEGVEKHDI